MCTGIYCTEFNLSISLNCLIMMVDKVKAIMVPVPGNNVLLHSLLPVYRLVLPGSEQWGTWYQVPGTYLSSPERSYIAGCCCRPPCVSLEKQC